MSPFLAYDPRFSCLTIAHANLEKLASGCRWAEGPAYFAAGRYLVWSDIPNNRMMRFDETDSSVSVFRSPSFNSNGNTVDREGRLVSCEHLMRRVTRTEHDGSITVLADRYDGRRLNSPNDVVVKSDGSIWFSDPTYGIDSDYEGEQTKSEIGASNVYRIDGISGKVTLVVSDRVQPNGLAFSPDEKLLYVADTGVSHVSGLPATIWSYKVEEQRTGASSLFATCPDGVYDGFRCDIHGNIWTSRPQRLLLRPRGETPGHDSDRGDRGECLFRRTPPQSALYLWADLALFDLSEHACCGLGDTAEQPWIGARSPASPCRHAADATLLVRAADREKTPVGPSECFVRIDKVAQHNF